MWKTWRVKQRYAARRRNLLSGWGTIVRRQGQTYTVLTNWHVVAIVRGDRTIVTDGLLHRPLGVPRRLGDTALAIVEFLCAIEYKVAPISAEPAAVGEPLRSVRFPAGAQAWAVARGFVELLLPKSLPQGYAWAIQMRLKLL